MVTIRPQLECEAADVMGPKVQTIVNVWRRADGLLRAQRLVRWLGLCLALMASGCGGGDLHSACKNGDARRVKALLESGKGDVNARDSEFGSSPLHWAAGGGHVEIMEMLLAKGANIEAKDKDGMTPLHAAAAKGQAAAVKLLLDKGADVNSRRNDGATALHGAALLDRTEVLPLLIAAGADVNAADHGKITPLMCAALAGSKTEIDALLAAGAYMDACDAKNANALDYAYNGKHADAIDDLVARGAKPRATQLTAQPPASK